MKTGVPCRFSAVSSPLIRLALARISVISVDADVFKAEQVAPESRLGLIRNFLSISFCFRRQVLYHISFSFLFLSAFLFFSVSPFSLVHIVILTHTVISPRCQS